MQSRGVLCCLLIAAAAYAGEPAVPGDADVVLGTGDHYQPALHWRGDNLPAGTVAVEAPVSLRTRFEGVSTFPLDADRTNLGENFFMVPQLRIGTRVEWIPRDQPWRFFGEYEHDLATGTLVGAPDVAGERLPNGEKTHNELRKLFGRVTLWDLVVVSGGYNTSHWGLGLLANDGAHGWTPGSARFSDPRSGDRVVRASIGTVPLTEYGLSVHAAYDSEVVGDEYLLEGDTADQTIFSALLGEGQPTYGGIYLVYREQDSSVHRGFYAFVADVMFSSTHEIDGWGTLNVAGEGVLINGHTRLGPNFDFPKHDLFQLAGALRASLDRGGYGGVFDILYASGDQNFDDQDQNAFHVDPNYEFGLMLYRYVIAGQTGRAPVTASNPVLIGKPVPDLDRVPTGGGPTNSIAFFPRAWWRPRNGLETYGGPLLALSEVKNADPFNTRLAGGQPRNALNGDPGNFWGAELDVGVRYRALLNGSEVTLGVETGVLLPGGALENAAGHHMGEVFDARAMVDYRL